MSNNNKIKTFIAADIEKYRKGLLSAKEMHNLEKAALDDPFLADALEGYAVTGVNINADIVELKNRLAKRIDESKTVPVITLRNLSSSQWWKIAAMFLLIAGAGLLVYQFGFNSKSTDIAQAVQKETVKSEAKDSGKINTPALLSTDTNIKSVIADQQKKDNTETEKNKTSSAVSTKEVILQKRAAPKATNDVEVTSTLSNAPVSKEEINKKETVSDNISQNKIKAAREEESNAGKVNNEELTVPVAEQKRSIAPVQSNENNYKGQRSKTFNQTNIFRGRVTDVNSNALPFSNITNTEDNIGTYSDAKGYFTLTSPDSILKVQVSSLGFESNNVQLQNNVASNKVLLQEDRSSLSEIVISNKKVNSNNRSRNNSLVLEEPEPADGWGNYDIYLANNLKVPETFKNKQAAAAGEVELSFDVTKDGAPINITIKKSLCETCDKEAIRLIKEGPKWKRKTKKGKATVTVSF